MLNRRSLLAALAVVVATAAAVPVTAAHAQWVTTYEQFYLQAPHNWEFRNRYQAADRLFNAFDYGHAILYETLWTQPDAPASLLEEKEYAYLTRKVLVRPPRVPLEEAAIEIRYAQLAPEAKQMFDWAHILHRQIYDVWADESIPVERKDAEVQRLIAYYRTRRDLAFSSRPKSMELMQEQPYSLAFRQQYPKFNGLIWGYHWLQVGLYEPLIVGRTVDERQAGVRATVARFWQMLQDPPRTLPYQMPMTAAVAPEFAKRYPEAAIIFDNLHSMHDVVSDILANDSVPRTRKRAEILRAAQLYRDDTSYVMTVPAWLTMSREMGVENMGGPSVGFLPALPTPTVTYGAVMEHDEQTGRMVGMKHGTMTGMAPSAGGMAGMNHGAAAAGSDSFGAGMAGMHHDASAAPRDSAGGMDHGAMNHGAMHHGSAAPRDAMMRLHDRMLTDTLIIRRLLADSTSHRMMHEAIEQMPPEQRAQMERTMGAMMAAEAARAPAARRPAARPPAPTARAATVRPATPARRPPPPPAADPHAGHTMPMPAAKPAPRPAPTPSTRDTTTTPRTMDHGTHRMP